ncbi:MAG: NADH-dependent [FeFe] hydrogenase, group A6 [Pseudomonadota bacterium]|nr:NADH-dependent [FeFe] hydrogenase, group A6 [Pseudomonadota bacterium]
MTETKTAPKADEIGATIKVEIDGRSADVAYGTTVLKAAKAMGIEIPTLCYHEDLCVSGACRMCIVEIEGERALHTSCSYPITKPISVKTTSPRIRRTRRHILDLMISEHYGECYTCLRNNNCELQELAHQYGVDSFRFGHKSEPEFEIDTSSHAIVRDMNKCIECGRCVRACTQMQDIGALEMIGRSDKTRVGTFMDIPLDKSVCINCGQCVIHCPTGALTELDETDDVWKAIDDPTKHVVIQTAPSPRAGIGEVFGHEPGRAFTFELNTALRGIGFDAVFDTNYSADLTIIEEGTELLLRLYKALVEKDESIALPQLTSCCPGWIKHAEHVYEDFLPNVSSAKSPQQMLGSLIKTYYAEKKGIDPKDIVSVSLMPCSAKKDECNRPEMNDSGHKDVDYVLTTREAGKMIKEGGIDLLKSEKSDFDTVFGTATGSGVIFGNTGGVMEAALRTVIELVTGLKVEDLFEHADIVPVRGMEGIRVIEIPITDVGSVPEILLHLVPNWDWLKGVTLKVAVAHGIANVNKVMENIKEGGPLADCHFIEFMACPGGCIGGGGMPIPTSPEIRKARAAAIYGEDRGYEIRKSHENAAVLQTYADFLTDGPCGHKSHKLLHTSYAPRGKTIS